MHIMTRENTSNPLYVNVMPPSLYFPSFLLSFSSSWNLCLPPPPPPPPSSPYLYTFTQNLISLMFCLVQKIVYTLNPIPLICVAHSHLLYIPSLFNYISPLFLTPIVLGILFMFLFYYILLKSNQPIFSFIIISINHKIF